MGNVTTKAGSGQIDVPQKTIYTIIAIIIILAYFIFPLDIIPDVVPVWGFVDDAIVFVIFGTYAYKQWS